MWYRTVLTHQPLLSWTSSRLQAGAAIRAASRSSIIHRWSPDGPRHSSTLAHNIAAPLAIGPTLPPVRSFPSVHWLRRLSSTAGCVDVASVQSASLTEGKVKVTWSSGGSSLYPLVWMRDNCQCHECYSHGSIARKFLMDNLESRPSIADLTATSSGDLEVQWKDGHKSPFTKEWLHGRKFEEKERKAYREIHKLPKIYWATNFKPSSYDYCTLMADDRELLKFLEDVEQNAAVLVTAVTSRPQAAFDLTNRIGRVQETHYGEFSNVQVQDNPENVSYSNFTLNLHNDLPQYQNQPGLIFLHMMKQHRGAGGDTTISDGLRAASWMRDHHKEQFRLLTTTNIYFLAKGADTNYDGTVKHFFKVNKEPVIKLDAAGEILSTHFNNQGRESHMDLPVEVVERFYDALLMFFHLLKQYSIHLRLSDGELAVIDNHRCQHGRLGFTGSSERHLVTTYTSWDEALCRRRRLHEHFRGTVL